MTQRGFAHHGRMHRSPKNASDRAPGPARGRRSPGGRPSGRRSRIDGHAGQQLALALGPAVRAPVARRAGAPAGRTRPRAASCRRARSPTRRAGRRSAPAGRPACRPRAGGRPRGRSGGGSSRRRRPTPGRSPRRAAPARSGVPVVAAHRRVLGVHPLADARLDQHAAGRRLDQQAVERLEQAPVLVELALGPRAPTGSRAPGPKSVPASERNVPAWMSATVVPPPRSARQWTASFSARHRLSPPSASFRPRSKSRWKADAVGSDWPWYLDPSSLRAVRPLDRAGHPEEADLADPHPEVEGDRQVRDVRQLEGQGALPARVDVARGRVDQEPQPAQASSCPRAWRRGRRAAPPTRASGRGRTRPGGG